jgi:predicted RNase H-like HicB family nuclease
MKYLVKIHWSEEDEAYVASVPALRGCVAHGSTYAEAAAMIEDAAAAWLASAEKHSDPIPAPDLAAESIRNMAPLLNVSKLARVAGINVYTLSSKLRRKSRFTEEESRKILRTLQEV